MISFMYLGKYGQMCNQMFQIGSVCGTAIKYDTDYIFNTWKYNKYYEIPIPTTGENKLFKNYNESCFHYKEIKLPIGDWNLIGYYQSEKYFEHCKTTIRNHFILKKEYKDYILNKYSFLKESNTCSIHIRRGDFLQLKQYHNVQPMEYYEKSIDKLYGNDKNKINFIVCSDDIEWGKKNLPKLNVKLTFIEGEENVIDLHILSLCENNIMSASSFSWWGAWLNDNPNKKIVAPLNWFGPVYKDHDIKDLIPNDWIRV